MNEERMQELYCHGCERYVRFRIDHTLNGNHEITCPNCGHIHYRLVENGEITDIRHQGSMGTFTAWTASTTWAVSWTTTSTASNYTSQSWVSRSDNTSSY